METSKILEADKMKLLSETEDEKFYVFLPSLFRLFPRSGDMRKMNLKNKIRFLWLYLSGYKVYVASTKDDIVKGSITLSRGGSFRFPFSTKNDLIDGPTYTVPEYRGQGVMVRLVDQCLNVFEKEYEKVYGTIEKENVASIKRCLKNGYDEIGFTTYHSLFHRCVINKNGEMVLVCYTRKKGEML